MQIAGDFDRISQFRDFSKVKRISPYGCAVLLAAADIASLFFASMFPAALYGGIGFGSLVQYSIVTSIGLPIFLIAACILGAYNIEVIFEWRPSVRRAVTAVLLMFAILMTLGFVSKTSADYSRFWFSAWIALSLGGLIAL